ncbi:TrfB-related DNA-binding protein [Burkholderia cepacia]|uniref:TrfB-related DNA-binding protein n=1 Tax=Burkholderia cepacia TaxID=292 RepID=UPI001EFA07E2|nr:TrfB-related DNA-binding protein [Burkholderia cepacia]
MATFRLSAKNFSALDSAMRNHAREFGTRPFDDATRDIARAVIVEGRAAVEVASKFGVSRQRVNQLVKRYYEALQDSELTDADVLVWLKHGFEVPSTLIEPLARFLAKAQRSKDTNKVQSAVAALIKNLGTQTSKLE